MSARPLFAEMSRTQVVTTLRKSFTDCNKLLQNKTGQRRESVRPSPAPAEVSPGTEEEGAAPAGRSRRAPKPSSKLLALNELEAIWPMFDRKGGEGHGSGTSLHPTKEKQHTESPEGEGRHAGHATGPSARPAETNAPPSAPPKVSVATVASAVAAAAAKSASIQEALRNLSALNEQCKTGMPFSAPVSKPTIRFGPGSSPDDRPGSAVSPLGTAYHGASVTVTAVPVAAAARADGGSAGGLKPALPDKLPPSSGGGPAPGGQRGVQAAEEDLDPTTVMDQEDGWEEEELSPTTLIGEEEEETPGPTPMYGPSGCEDDEEELEPTVVLPSTLVLEQQDDEDGSDASPFDVNSQPAAKAAPHSAAAAYHSDRDGPKLGPRLRFVSGIRSTKGSLPPLEPQPLVGQKRRQGLWSPLGQPAAVSPAKARMEYPKENHASCKGDKEMDLAASQPAPAAAAVTKPDAAPVAEPAAAAAVELAGVPPVDPPVAAPVAEPAAAAVEPAAAPSAAEPAAEEQAVASIFSDIEPPPLSLPPSSATIAPVAAGFPRNSAVEHTVQDPEPDAAAAVGPGVNPSPLLGVSGLLPSITDAAPLGSGLETIPLLDELHMLDHGPSPGVSPLLDFTSVDLASLLHSPCNGPLPAPVVAAPPQPSKPASVCPPRPQPPLKPAGAAPTEGPAQPAPILIPPPPPPIAFDSAPPPASQEQSAAPATAPLIVPAPPPMPPLVPPRPQTEAVGTPVGVELVGARLRILWVVEGAPVRPERT